MLSIVIINSINYFKNDILARQSACLVERSRDHFTAHCQKYNAKIKFRLMFLRFQNCALSVPFLVCLIEKCGENEKGSNGLSTFN